jgi:hypothetical protein
VSIRRRRSDEPLGQPAPGPAGSPAASFGRLIDRWFQLTYVLNNLNRGFGLPDAYPFVLSTAAIETLRLVHDTVATASSATAPHQGSHELSSA